MHSSLRLQHPYGQWSHCFWEAEWQRAGNMLAVLQSQVPVIVGSMSHDGNTHVPPLCRPDR